MLTAGLPLEPAQAQKPCEPLREGACEFARMLATCRSDLKRAFDKLSFEAESASE